MFRRTGHLTISSKEPTLGGAKDREILFIVNQYKMEEGIIFRSKTTVCVRKVVYFIRCKECCPISKDHFREPPCG